MKKQHIYIGLMIIVAVAFGSCGTTSNVSSGSGKAVANIPFSESMKREAARMWTSLPEGGSPVFIGFSTGLYDDEQEKFRALQAAAGYASAYDWLEGETGLLDTRKGHFSFIEYRYDFEKADDYLKDMEIVDSYTDNRGTIVLAKLKGVSMPEIGYNPIPRGLGRGGKPEWTTKIPQIPGYHVAVGINEKKFDLATSFLEADKQALAEILRLLNLQVKAGTSEQVIETVGEIQNKVSSQRSEAEVRGFYVIARWQSEDGKTFYSLAVCPKNQ